MLEADSFLTFVLVIIAKQDLESDSWTLIELHAFLRVL